MIEQDDFSPQVVKNGDLGYVFYAEEVIKQRISEIQAQLSAARRNLNELIALHGRGQAHQRLIISNDAIYDHSPEGCISRLQSLISEAEGLMQELEHCDHLISQGQNHWSGDLGPLIGRALSRSNPFEAIDLASKTAA